MQNKTFRQLLLIINFTFAKIKIAKSGFFTYSQNINNANISQYTVICLGLSMLPESDLTTMRNEMSDKITKLSNELVSLLQNRDSLHLGTVAKNRFIQAMLRVQESKHAMQNTTTLSGSLGDTGTESREQESDDARYRRRSRSRSLQHFSRSIIARAKNLRTVEEDKATSDMVRLLYSISSVIIIITTCLTLIFVNNLLIVFL